LIFFKQLSGLSKIPTQAIRQTNNRIWLTGVGGDQPSNLLVDLIHIENTGSNSGIEQSANIIQVLMGS